MRAAPRVAIVNESFARKFALGRGAVGRRLGRGGPGVELDTEIVGLVADTRYNSVKIEGLTPAAVAVSVLTLAAVALAAGFVPARRASRIDPMAALRHE